MQHVIEEEEKTHVSVGVHHIEIAELDVLLIRKTLTELGLAGGGATEALVTRLATHYGAEGVGLAWCDHCGGGSDPDLDACPFCGHDDSDVIGDEDDDDEEDLEMSELNGAAASVATQATPPSKAKPAKVKSIALAKPVEAQLVTNDDFNQAVDRVHAELASARASAWKIGIELKPIYDADLWRMSKKKYKGFHEFVKQEFNLSKEHAFNCIRAAAYFTEQQIRDIGVTKLSLVVRGELGSGALRKGAGPADAKAVEKVQKKAKEVKKKTLVQVKKETKDAGTGGKRGRKSTVTVIKVGDKEQTWLYASPLNEEEKKKPRKAKTLADKPWGQIVYDNGVSQWFRIRETANGLQLTTVTKRIDEEE
jgi:hypothetical protein